MKKIRQNNSQENKDEKEQDLLYSPHGQKMPENVRTMFIKINPTLQAATFLSLNYQQNEMLFCGTFLSSKNFPINGPNFFA